MKADDMAAKEAPSHTTLRYAYMGLEALVLLAIGFLFLVGL